MYAESFVALVSLLSVHAAVLPDAPLLPLQSLPVAKYTASSPVHPVQKNPNAFGIHVTAKSAVVMDLGSGEILFQKNANQRASVASLTKLVTAMTFLDMRPALADEVVMIEDDNPNETKQVFLTGERLTKRELLQALLVGSINMAANALARSTGDTAVFVKAMNTKARSLGLSYAAFVDPVGISMRNQASAKDVAILLRAALAYPDIREATEMNQLTIAGRLSRRPYVVKSTNLLLGSFLNKDPYRIVAAKTGSLPEAGYSLAQVTRNGEGREVIVVVLGSENHFVRFQDAKTLTFWAFENFEWPKPAAMRGTVSMR